MDKTQNPKLKTEKKPTLIARAIRFLLAKEPTLTIGAVQALLAVAIGFWLGELTPALVITATGALLALLTRSQVFAPATVDALIETAVKMPVDTQVSAVKEKLAETLATD